MGPGRALPQESSVPLLGGSIPVYAKFSEYRTWQHTIGDRPLTTFLPCACCFGNTGGGVVHANGSRNSVRRAGCAATFKVQAHSALFHHVRAEFLKAHRLARPSVRKRQKSRDRGQGLQPGRPNDVQRKLKAAEMWCKQRNMEYILATFG